MNNPLKEIINDEQYEKLSAGNFLNLKEVRDKMIRDKFYELRSIKMKVDMAIEEVQKEFPHLTFETIKRIIYK